MWAKTFDFEGILKMEIIVKDAYIAEEHLDNTYDLEIIDPHPLLAPLDGVQKLVLEVEAAQLSDYYVETFAGMALWKGRPCIVATLVDAIGNLCGTGETLELGRFNSLTKSDLQDWFQEVKDDPSAGGVSFFPESYDCEQAGITFYF